MSLDAKNIIGMAAIFGATAVALGAFGAHGLKPHLDAYQAGIYEKAVHYQFFHTLALLGVGLLLGQRPGDKYLVWAAWMFMMGVLFFSGSLYLLACGHLLPFPVGWAGPVTPLGGLGFIFGWLWVALSAWKK